MAASRRTSPSHEQSPNNQKKQNTALKKWLRIAVTIGISLAAILLAIILLVCGNQHAYFVCLIILFVLGFAVFGLGFVYLFRPTPLNIQHEKFQFSGITFGILFLILGSLIMGFVAYLLDNRNETTQPKSRGEQTLSEGEKHLNRAKKLYENGQYNAVLRELEMINLYEDNLLDEVQYYTIMARYHSLEVSVRRYEYVDPNEIQRLEDAFERFINERQNSTWFDTIQYWLGHLYLQVCNDRESAMPVFDEIIEDNFNSGWIQGSLYYSALLHHEKDTPADGELALKRLIMLKKVGGLLRIVESGKDFRAAGIAEEQLMKWGVTTSPHDANVP